ncbi:EAL domain-containing protein [Simiduia sp. 21SJ11W-1]|uniref:putative bifunctional diguanylate cyclase/phosphodiesterase n=1 Tax=Simiduia sp. 21SJ11W-1 TaxID=2909669 RepID=UPI00209F836E|nr:GGDEF domain-containing response regulator [Simiduia sp. 21SJ11W-1]UTA47190.1 EAL domain-containing protein [Simiduia sp. 21SJ11W-1]
MRALIIDDDELDRISITRTLRKARESYCIDTAESAETARQKISGKAYDVILLDYRLPDVEGLEFIMEIRKRLQRKQTAVVMISNMEDEDLAMRCLKAGAQDFLLKSSINPIMLKMAIANSILRHELETALKSSFEQVKVLAERDSLTKLANRFLFEESVSLALQQRHRKNPVTLFFFDVDNFKKINDTWGHTYGDQLLKRISSRISSCLRGGELLARIGGDEFALFMDDAQSSIEANHAALRIMRVMQSPFSFDSFDFYASLSIGITVQDRRQATVDQLLSQADIAMHKAKALGKAQICYFEDAMQEEFVERVRIETGLRHALDNNEFVMYYQPIIEPKTGSILGYEALIRWQHQGQLISPDVFIPIAQESHLIMDIGRWIIEDVFANHPPLSSATGYLSINLSPLQLIDTQLPAFILEQAAKHQVKPGNVELEITETAFIDDSDDTQSLIRELVKHGFNFALDDFGTGYSSLSHLQSLPISTVKIDRSLLLTEPAEKMHKILQGLTEIILALDFNVVLEGVETEDQARLGTRLNINRAQGYYYSKPLPAQAFLQSPQSQITPAPG